VVNVFFKLGWGESFEGGMRTVAKSALIGVYGND
jgi:hypothetical protein